MTTTREWKTQSLCLHCGKSEINHHPCVVAPGIWLCRPCANEISNPQLRQLREDTLQDLCNQGLVEFTMSSEDGFETLDNEYEELMLQDSWETHLAPCPEGLFLIRSDFCADSAEILHVITDPSNDDNTVAAILEQPDEDRVAYFFQQENGELERLNCRQFHTNMKYLNPSSENRWSYPTSPFGSITRKRPKPMGVQHTPDFNRMQADHRWHAPNPMLEHEFLTCSDCQGQMHLTTSGQTITRVWVKLPLERECFYLQANGTLTPVDDQTFRGNRPKRVPTNSRENDYQPQTRRTPAGLSTSRTALHVHQRTEPDTGKATSISKPA